MRLLFFGCVVCELLFKSIWLSKIPWMWLLLSLTKVLLPYCWASTSRVADIHLVRRISKSGLGLIWLLWIVLAIIRRLRDCVVDCMFLSLLNIDRYYRIVCLVDLWILETT